MLEIDLEIITHIEDPYQDRQRNLEYIHLTIFFTKKNGWR